MDWLMFQIRYIVQSTETNWQIVDSWTGDTIDEGDLVSIYQKALRLNVTLLEKA